LTSYGFFVEDLASLSPAKGVLPYTVSSPLWSDNAGKERFLVLPADGAVEFSLLDSWELPQETVLIKHFYFADDLSEPTGPRRVIETRLLINEGEEWNGYIYLWNDAQTEATKIVAGTFVDVEYLNTDGSTYQGPYVVPNSNQCKNCHSNDDRNQPIGATTRQLNIEVTRDGVLVNQISWLAKQGVFSGSLPDLDNAPVLAAPDGLASLDARARSYLESNCGHCHRAGGDGGTSGLVLLADEINLTAVGLCKKPVAAGSGSGGLLYDIVPGSPEESIMLYRMKSLDPQIKMPEITNLRVPEDGVELITEWILSLEPEDCGN